MEMKLGGDGRGGDRNGMSKRIHSYQASEQNRNQTESEKGGQTWKAKKESTPVRQLTSRDHLPGNDDPRGPRQRAYIRQLILELSQRE